MSSVETFSYGSVKIGGAATIGGGATEVLTQYLSGHTQDDAEFTARFVVRVPTPSSTPSSDWSALDTACQAVISALRQRYAKLTVDWSATNQETWDPSTSATLGNMGFDQEPQLRKLDKSEFPNSGEARGYELRVRLGLPPNYTDAFGAAAGRRQVNADFRYDTENREMLVVTGEWTQVPSALARDQFLASIDGASGYAAYRLSLVNGSVAGLSAATWTIKNKSETDPNALTTLRFTRVYVRHVFGRWSATVSPTFSPSTVRPSIAIRGTYLRTIDGTGGAYGNVFGTAHASSVNFSDGTNGGRAFAETASTGQLATLSSGQGGALTYGNNCELIGEPAVSVNEQDDQTDYVLIYRELTEQQSTNVTSGFLDDPNIADDRITWGTVFSEASDSPVPTAPQGYEPPAPGGGTTAAQKPADVFVHYECWLKKTAGDPATYYKTYVLPLLLNNLKKAFPTGNPGGTEFVSHKFQTDTTQYKISADLRLRAYQVNIVAFEYAQGIFDDTGVRIDPAFTGTPHEYLVQQALPKRTLHRSLEAVFVPGSIDILTWSIPQAYVGWVKISSSRPNTKTRILGIPSLGMPQQPMTYATLEEDFVWVARNVGDGKTQTGQGGSQPPAKKPPAQTQTGGSAADLQAYINQQGGSGADMSATIPPQVGGSDTAAPAGHPAFGGGYFGS